MKSKTLFIASLVLFPLMFSCVKEKSVSQTYRVGIDTPTVQVDGSVTLVGVDVENIIHDECDCYFLCSSDGGDFSAAPKISAKRGSGRSYTASYKPSADGTFYVKFCVDNMGLSYTESEVMAFEYKQIDFSIPVDMGLPSGIKWATCNLGAKTPLEYGGYYQWAGTEDVTSTSINLDWSNCPYHTGTSSSTGWTKYNTKSSYGTVDKKTALDLGDDVAHVQLGGKWRMPTDAEWTELRNNCTWTWTTQGGVKGYKVTSKKTGNSLFLPAAGYRYDTKRDYAGSVGYYRSSSPYTDDTRYAYGLRFGSSYFERDYKYGYRYYGQSVRPILDESLIPVTGVTVTPSTSSVEMFKTLQLTAAVQPTNATCKDVVWSSSDESVASVSADGLVTALLTGTVTITATAAGGKTAACTVTVTSNQQWSEAIDLGLPSGVKWAQVNLGAKTPEEYGSYYAWGETEPEHLTGWSTYKWAATGGKIEYGMSGYCASNKFGSNLDYKLVLGSADDAATASLGKGWRLPTSSEFKELLDNCSKKWDSKRKGYTLTSNKNGASIFLPAAGKRDAGKKDLQGSTGYYWSMNVDVKEQRQAEELFLSEGESPVLSSYSRWTEVSIRPVQGEFKRVEKVYLDETEINLKVGEHRKLVASFYPSKPTVTDLTWVGSPSIATVDQNGEITAVGPGTATIEVYSADGGIRKSCKVNVALEITGLASVDLGLPSGLKWATLNVGASSPEKSGLYFALGDVEGQNWDGKYWSGGGFYKSVGYKLDSDNNLLPQYDAAHTILGGKWRMPTHTELKELFNYCSYSLCTISGVDGYLIKSKQTGYTDKYIFIPKVGYGYQSDLKYPGHGFYLWSKTYIEKSGFYYIIDGGGGFSYHDYNGMSIRAVWDDSIVPVTGVTVSPSKSSVEMFKTLQLTATVQPSNASSKDVVWSSSDESVASVSAEGLVMALSTGTATVTATAGGKTSTCTVAVTPMSDSVVDLGLPSGIKWARCNVGAKTPLEYGGYYQWAGTQDVTSTSIKLSWSNCPYHTGSSEKTGWTKYNTKSSYGDVDKKTVLELSDDIAHVQLGGKWRMPTEVEFQELIDNCTWTWTTLNKVNGYMVSGKKSGYTSNSIFLPAAGYRHSGSLYYVGSKAHYWSSSLNADNPSDAYDLSFYSETVGTINNGRYFGRPIRPILE